MTARHTKGLPKGPINTPLGLLHPMGQPPPAFHLRAERSDAPSGEKLSNSLESALDAAGLADGQTLSFHHHYRNGDRLMCAVIEHARAQGIKGLTLCPSSIFPVHAPLVAALEDGTVTSIITDYMRGPVADWLTDHPGRAPAILQSHGARARALSTRQIAVDLAVVAASQATPEGDCTGRGGPLACGPLGYPAVDAAYAKRTIVAAHEILPKLTHIDIPGRFVDAVIPFDRPGDSSLILSGSTIAYATAEARALGALVADIVDAAGLLTTDFALQSGAGGYSLGAVPAIGQRMAARGVSGAYLSGGLTRDLVNLHKQGLFRKIWDVQCFDLDAVQSSITNPEHRMMSAADYASPLNTHAKVNGLSVMLLGAVEVDHDFNVNVVSGADGRILGGPGGHPDAAQGAQLSIVTTGLTGGGYPKIVPSVRTISTPGHDVDVVVSGGKFAVNPKRPDLVERLKDQGLISTAIEDLGRQARDDSTASPAPQANTPSVYVEHRDGLLLDWV